MNTRSLVKIIAEMKGLSVATDAASRQTIRIDGTLVVEINPEWLLEVSRALTVWGELLTELLPNVEIGQPVTAEALEAP